MSCSLPSATSKIKLCGDLHLPWILSSGDDAEGRRTQDGSRQCKIGPVDCIESLQPELEPHIFANTEILVQGQVRAEITRPAYIGQSAWRVADRERSRLSERGHVKPGCNLLGPTRVAHDIRQYRAG